MMFDTVLIANRGEIACRIARTARRMGIRSVAVYSDTDRDAAYVAEADCARRIGAAPARESYLSIDKLIEAAHWSGSQAIHPGYGFLSENADFATACIDAGLIFIGPPAAAIRAMGSKSAAKSLMASAGVPLVPGYHGDDQTPERLAEHAAAIGYPVLIKASAGGGGKGMRIVTDKSAFAAALAMAKGEAQAAFGDDHVLIEKYLTRPRHIEIQVFADTFGNVVSLFERDCSIQRRHQKIIEEAPAPLLSDDRRFAMGEAACAAARAIGYVGAGTVEFIVENDQFHFMEMNTRLQVEHPVTEMITGLDLVEWQFRVAAGEPLPLSQNEIERTGHAIEVRIYAEDPTRDFAPSTGTVQHLRLPAPSANIRLDSGIRSNDTVSVHYDPMIAKLIAWDHDRAGAIRHMAMALAATEIDGVRTNLPLLRRIIGHHEFAVAAFDTGFIARHEAELLAPPPAPSPGTIIAAAARWLHNLAPRRDTVDPHSPWATSTAWRLNGPALQDLVLDDGITQYRLQIDPSASPHLRFVWESVTIDALVTVISPDRINLSIKGEHASFTTVVNGDAIIVFEQGERFVFHPLDPFATPDRATAATGRILTTMPGRVTAVDVVPGDLVAVGDLLITVEAMKVQFRITAPNAGIVGEVLCSIGDLVEDGAELAIIKPALSASHNETPPA